MRDEKVGQVIGGNDAPLIGARQLFADRMNLTPVNGRFKVVLLVIPVVEAQKVVDRTVAADRVGSLVAGIGTIVFGIVFNERQYLSEVPNDGKSSQT